MIEYHDVWLLKAENDLRLAEVAIRQDEPITDGAIYHTQSYFYTAIQCSVTSGIAYA